MTAVYWLLGVHPLFGIWMNVQVASLMVLVAFALARRLWAARSRGSSAGCVLALVDSLEHPAAQGLD